MNPRVRSVKPEPDFKLTLTFTDGSVRIFDMTPYLEVGVFQELKDFPTFASVRPFLGSITWKNGQDLCPDTLYEDSLPVSS